MKKKFANLQNDYEKLRHEFEEKEKLNIQLQKNILEKFDEFFGKLFEIIVLLEYKLKHKLKII